MPVLKNDGRVVAYTRREPPIVDPETLPQYVLEELRRIEQNLDSLNTLICQVSYAEPTTKVIGMTRYAKSPWNPLGTGDGFVKWNGTAWVGF